MMRLVGGVFLVLALVPTIGAASPDDEAEMPEIFVPRYCEADDFSGDCETSYAIGDELPDPPDAVPLDRKAPPVIYDEPKPLSRITVEELDGRQIDGEMMDGRNATAAPINNTTLPPEIPEFTGDKKVPVFVVTVTCFTMAALGCVVVTLRSRADERRTRLAQEALRNQITREVQEHRDRKRGEPKHSSKIEGKTGSQSPQKMTKTAKQISAPPRNIPTGPSAASRQQTRRDGWEKP
ncbi:unnamed protein product, partial [Mesorhabditis spiculigera]